MNKISKDELKRREGVKYALTMIEEKGVEAFLKDCEWRGITTENKQAYDLESRLLRMIHPDVPLRVSKGQFDEFMETNKRITVATIGVMACMTLHDEFGFGEDRLKRFLERFDLKTEVLEAAELTETTWRDYQEILKEECNITIDIPGYDGGREIKR